MEKVVFEEITPEMEAEMRRSMEDFERGDYISLNDVIARLKKKIEEKNGESSNQGGVE